MEIRTDLALEVLEDKGFTGCPPKGICLKKENRFGLEATVVEITGRNGEKKLGRPRGTYITLDIESVLRRERDSFSTAVKTIAGYLEELLKLPRGLPVLVAGLGNRDITPDALGPLTADHILVTRHMVRMQPKAFGSFRPVSAVVPGVLGTTGLESTETVRALVEKTQAAAVIAVDAIAARQIPRLCSTIQLCDTGISPGAGIGSQLRGLNQQELGVPVVGIGVPTVTDGATFAMDVLQRAGKEAHQGDIQPTGMIVTCSDIDRRVREVARVLSYGINACLHGGLDLEELEDLTF